jgi:hypothetical protein
MQQHDTSGQNSSSSSAANGQTSSAANTNNSTTPSPKSTAPTPNAPTNSDTPQVPTRSDIASMAAKAAALAANVPSTPVKDATSTDADQKNSTTTATDLATLLAQIQAALLGTSTTSTVATKTTSDPATTTSDETSDPTAAKDPTASTPVAVAPDFSTMIAQASILANAQQAAAAAATTATGTTGQGKESPLSGLGKAAAGTSAKEKKSGSSLGEGSFLQGSSSTSDSTSSLLAQLGAILNGGKNATDGQQVTADGKSKNAALTAVSDAASATAGTANVEKGKTMNADSKLSGLEAMAGLATPAAAAQQQPADMHILLNSNNDFEDAIKQVMHVASLTQTAESRTPLRVEMEVQTPPGAIVNIYVSKQGDSFRAQLSTNNLEALNWVQDKISSLRQSSDIGVQVKWLPPQMEAASTGSGSGANLGWDRGGQGQSGYQNSEQQQQSQSNRQQASQELELAGVGADDFSDTLASLGSAA